MSEYLTFTDELKNKSILIVNNAATFITIFATKIIDKQSKLVEYVLYSVDTSKDPNEILKAVMFKPTPNFEDMREVLRNFMCQYDIYESTGGLINPWKRLSDYINVLGTDTFNLYIYDITPKVESLIKLAERVYYTDE